MELLEKLAAMKKKVDELDSKINSISKESNLQLNSLKGELLAIRELTSKIDSLSLKFSHESEHTANRLNGVENNVKKNLSNFASGIGDYNKNFSQVESTFSQMNSEIKKIEERTEELEKRAMESGSKDSRSVKEFASSLDSLQKNVERYEREMKKILLETPTDKDVRELRAEMLKLKKELSDKVSEVDVNKIKKATDNIDKVIESSLSDIREEFDEIKTKMENLVELQNLHKHFAEMKMDVASTEAGLNRRMEELQQNVEMIKDEMEKYPQFEVLSGQDKALRAHMEKLETKFDVDFEKMLNEFEKLGTIFAKRSEVEMSVSEIKGTVDRIEDMMRELDGKHMELEKQIVIREDAKDQNVSDRVNEALAQVQYMFEEFQKQRKRTEDIDDEFNVIKEQIITTQNALMEMNSFLQEQMRPKY